MARPSIGTPHSRWLTMRWRTTLNALAKAASVSPAAMRFSCSTLPGASAWTWGAPGFRASSGSLTAGSGSQSTTTSAAASTGGLLGGGDDRRDRLADVADALDGEGVVLPADRRLALAALGRRLVDGHGAAVGLEVGAGDDRDDARALQHGRGVDPADPRVGVRAPDERHVVEARHAKCRPYTSTRP